MRIQDMNSAAQEEFVHQYNLAMEHNRALQLEQQEEEQEQHQQQQTIHFSNSDLNLTDDRNYSTPGFVPSTHNIYHTHQLNPGNSHLSQITQRLSNSCGNTYIAANNSHLGMSATPAFSSCTPTFNTSADMSMGRRNSTGTMMSMKSNTMKMAMMHVDNNNATNLNDAMPEQDEVAANNGHDRISYSHEHMMSPLSGQQGSCIVADDEGSPVSHIFGSNAYQDIGTYLAPQSINITSFAHRRNSTGNVSPVKVDIVPESPVSSQQGVMDEADNINSYMNTQKRRSRVHRRHSMEHVVSMQKSLTERRNSLGSTSGISSKKPSRRRPSIIKKSNSNVSASSADTAEITKPKRALSAYNIFFRYERAKLLGTGQPKPYREADDDRSKKRPHRKTHGKIGFTELAKHCADQWKTMSAGNKEYFEEKAADEKKRYLKAMDRYNNGALEGAGRASLESGGYHDVPTVVTPNAEHAEFVPHHRRKSVGDVSEKLRDVFKFVANPDIVCRRNSLPGGITPISSDGALQRQQSVGLAGVIDDETDQSVVEPISHYADDLKKVRDDEIISFLKTLDGNRHDVQRFENRRAGMDAGTAHGDFLAYVFD